MGRTPQELYSRGQEGGYGYKHRDAGNLQLAESGLSVPDGVPGQTIIGGGDLEDIGADTGGRQKISSNWGCRRAVEYSVVVPKPPTWSTHHPTQRLSWDLGWLWDRDRLP